MALNDVVFNIGDGALGRKASGEDHVSALLFPSLASPSSYVTLQGKEYYDLKQVEQDGITELGATYNLVWYHAREFFRIAKGAKLWLIFNTASAQTIHSITEGRLRQLATTVSDMADIQSVWQAFATQMNSLHAPIQVLLGWDTAFNPATAEDLATKASQNVSLLIAGDGGAKGAALATLLTKAYIPCIGAVLGVMAKAKVHQNIGWVKRFNLSDGRELEIVRIADGTNKPSFALLTLMNDKRYLTLRKHTGISGSYMNDSHTATVETSDYATIELNRTLHKMRRGLRRILLPELNAPVYVDPTTGKLAADSIAYFESLASRPLRDMQNERELSGEEVYIDPDQNILATSTLVIQARGIPVGVARHIVVDLGFEVAVNF